MEWANLILCRNLLVTNNIHRHWGRVTHICVSKLKGLSYLQFSFNVNATLRIPKLSGGTIQLITGKECETAIPMAALKTNFYFGRPRAIPFKPPIIWGNNRYTMSSRGIPVSWEDAAKYCTAMSGNHLTIQDLKEYNSIEETFLSSYDMVLMYVGLRLKVNVWLNWLSSILWFIQLLKPQRR